MSFAIPLFHFRSHLKQFGMMSGDPLLWWKAGLGIAAATIVGFFVVKAFHGPGSAGR